MNIAVDALYYEVCGFWPWGWLSWLGDGVHGSPQCLQINTRIVPWILSWPLSVSISFYYLYSSYCSAI